MLTQSANLTGSVIRGYQFHEALGHGTFATVYRAKRHTLDTDVAIKAIKPEIARNPHFIERFEREARLISRLKHPNITTLYDYWRDEYGAYIVMAFYDGGGLRQRIKQGRLPLEDILLIFEALADVLDYAHREGIVHRDVKPENILFDIHGNPYLGDFGIAKDTQFGGDSLTGANDIVGTIRYCAPEQLNSETLSPQTDIFSLGIILYEMLEGEHPFPNTSTIQCAAHLLHDPLPMLELDFVNDAMNAVIQKATAKAPSDRFDNALEMAAAFREAVEAESRPRIEKLTPRELEVLQHLADGLDNNEIAEAMFIERATVRYHLQNLYPKLGAESRGHAIIIAHQHNLIFRELEKQVEPHPASAILRTNLRRHNLPAETSEFVGRKEEISQISEVLNDPRTRLITILAPGGMGKSALAMEVARQQFDNFRDGVYFVELAPLEDAQQIPSAIAEAVDFQFHKSGTPNEQILNYLEFKKLLLVLDNFEHLLDGRQMVSRILAKAPEVQIIVTSRERLSLRSETVMSLSGLGFPVTKDGLKDYESPDLFIQELQRHQSNFDLDDETAPYVLRICQLVEGMPLALILAAAWGDMLSVEEIAEQIEKSLDFLAAEMSDMPHRHWDVRATIEATWERLCETEQNVFMKLSVFHGGCTREAAEAVTGANLRTLMALVNKALLRRDTDSGRFTIHELLRQYAAERLKQHGTIEAVRDTHMNYYAQFMQERENYYLKDNQMIVALDEIESDFENIWAAWFWAVEQAEENALEKMCQSIKYFAYWRSRSMEANLLFNAATVLEGHISRRVWGKLLVRHTYFLRDFGLDERAIAKMCEEALDIARQNEDKNELAYALQRVAGSQANLGQGNIALQLIDEAINLYIETGNVWGQTGAMEKKAYIHVVAFDQYEESYHLWKEIIEIKKQHGDMARGIQLYNIAIYENLHGDFTAARAYLEEALDTYEKLETKHECAETKAALADIERDNGHLDKAAKLALEAYQDALETGIPFTIGVTLRSRFSVLIRQERFQEGLNITDEMAALYHDVENQAHLWHMENCRGIALCGLEKYKEASVWIDKALIHGMDTAQPAHFVDILFGKSMTLAQYGQQERALELLALVCARPESRPWRDKHPLVLRLKKQLQAHFSEAEYDEIWARGQSKVEQWREVLQELVDEIELDEDTEP